MNITIIGTGRMATNLAAAWTRPGGAGHTVTFGSRSGNGTVPLPGGAQAASRMAVTPALAVAEVVVLAIPYATVAGFARDHAAALNGPLVIDISNPFADQPADGRAGAQVTADAIGAGARVAAAFKATFFTTLLEPTDPETDLQRDVWFSCAAADSDLLATLIGDTGFRPVYCGALERAVVLDLLVPLIIDLDRELLGGRRSGSFRLL